MRTTCLTVLVLFLVSVPYASAYETLNTIFVDGTASMVMDGNLDDWENIPAQEVPVTHSVEKTRDDASVITAYGENDCKFSFKCFADKNYVYFALIVKDDVTLVGRNVYGKGWLDDSTTLYFDGDCVETGKNYYDANDGQLKVIGIPPSGVKYIEGYVPYFYEGNIPYFWEARGVKSGFKITEDGYITEIALPASLLGWDGITSGKIMGANLRVVDKDGDATEDITDKGFIWAPDPEHTAHYSARSYNRISFSIVVPSQGSSTQATNVIQNTETINVALGAPDFSEGEILFNSVLADLGEENFAEAEAKLLPMQDKIWVKPLLGLIQIRKNDYNGIYQLINFGKECPSPWGEEYVKVYVNEYIDNVIGRYKGKPYRSQRSHETLGNIYKVFTDIYPTDVVGLYDYANYLKNISLSNRAKNYYNTIIQLEASSQINEEDMFRALKIVGKSYIELGEFEQADAVLKKIEIMYPEKSICADMASGFSLVGDYSSAIRIYERIINTSNDTYQKHNALFRIMMSYFYINDFEKVISMINENPELQERVEARLILNAIDMRLSNGEKRQ